MYARPQDEAYGTPNGTPTPETMTFTAIVKP